MTVSAASLKVRFPSLSTAPDASCTVAIAEAERRTPADIWGDRRDDGISYLAAHLVCLDPRGINAKLVDKTGRTTYLSERERLDMIVSAGHRLTTGDPYTWLV